MSSHSAPAAANAARRDRANMRRQHALPRRLPEPEPEPEPEPRAPPVLPSSRRQRRCSPSALSLNGVRLNGCALSTPRDGSSSAPGGAPVPQGLLRTVTSPGGILASLRAPPPLPTGFIRDAKSPARRQAPLSPPRPTHRTLSYSAALRQDMGCPSAAAAAAMGSPHSPAPSLNGRAVSPLKSPLPDGARGKYTSIPTDFSTDTI